MKLKNAGRAILSVLFLVGGIVHIYLVTNLPSVYTSFADFAFLPFYTALWRRLVLPNLTVWVLLLIVFEFSVSLLLTLRGTLTKLGLVLASVFVLFLVPFWWMGGALINIAILVILIWLISRDYPRSLWAILFGRREAER